MAETLISMVVFIPLFVSIPVLGKYMDIKQKALEATRYAVWERTIWAGNNGAGNGISVGIGTGWGDEQVNRKPEQTIIEEIDRRFYGHPLQGLDDARQTENPLWGTRQGGEDIRFLGRRASEAQDTDDTTALRAELPVYDSILPGYGAPGAGRIVDAVANTGLSRIPGIGRIASAVGDLSIGECGLGVSLDHGLFLGRSNRIDLTLETPINNVLGQSDLVISTTAGILSNAWVVPRDEAGELDGTLYRLDENEELYRRRVGRITAAEPNCVATPAAIFGRFAIGVDLPLFGEVSRAAPAGGTFDTFDTLNPAALPPEREINSNASN
ncbi:MAG: hypothetical protein COB94_007775 [Gammaproteobacteria bacterium]|nr:hypothetical protein [Gammaproteobacteria bacterium]